MALFFFVVGLEIKRELVLGELRDPKAALPVICALGGMIAPAALYLAVAAGIAGRRSTSGHPHGHRYRLLLGVLALLGSRVPLVEGLPPHPGHRRRHRRHPGDRPVLQRRHRMDLAGGGRGRLRHGRRPATDPGAVRDPYRILAAALWLFLYKAGIHPTIAGVVLGLLDTGVVLPPAGCRGGRRPRHPGRRRRDAAGRSAPLGPAGSGRSGAGGGAATGSGCFLGMALHPWSAWVVLPIFALANAGGLVRRLRRWRRCSRNRQPPV